MQFLRCLVLENDFIHVGTFLKVYLVCDHENYNDTVENLRFIAVAWWRFSWLVCVMLIY